MKAQEQVNYERIEEAIGYIREHFREQPDLDKIASEVHLSPFHFQRMFQEWAGTTPKKFLQYLSITHAKSVLAGQATLFDAAYDTGLSGTGRLHDLFISIEGMTPAEYRDGGAGLTINYSFAESPFGNVLVASTAKGVCYMAFHDGEDPGLEELKRKFPNAVYVRKLDMLQQDALFIFQKDWSRLSEIKLHLKGTPFQLKVWEALLKIPMASLRTYGQLAGELSRPTASRAVGTAVGDNPVAFLIPCHRVIQSTGAIGQYHWGSNRKAAIIGWEAARVFTG
jgi:AraC family transcriptional regulator of adaptative response/methylated-DNA-[protein]-cysteine methyltransferase